MLGAIDRLLLDLPLICATCARNLARLASGLRPPTRGVKGGGRKGCGGSFKI